MMSEEEDHDHYDYDHDHYDLSSCPSSVVVLLLVVGVWLLCWGYGIHSLVQTVQRCLLSRDDLPSEKEC